MKYKLLLTLMLSLSSIAQDTFEFKTDKQLHLGAGIGISYVIGDITYSRDLPDFAVILIPIVATNIVGAGKEIYDAKFGGNVSIHDMIYTFAGGVIGSLLHYGIKKIFYKYRKFKVRI